MFNGIGTLRELWTFYTFVQNSQLLDINSCRKNALGKNLSCSMMMRILKNNNVWQCLNLYIKGCEIQLGFVCLLIYFTMILQWGTIKVQWDWQLTCETWYHLQFPLYDNLHAPPSFFLWNQWANGHIHHFSPFSSLVLFKMSIKICVYTVCVHLNLLMYQLLVLKNNDAKKHYTLQLRSVP